MIGVVKSWLKYTLATAFFVVGVGGSVTYNQFLEPYLNSEWVYVATQNLSANTALQPTDWLRERVLRSEVSPEAITNKNQLLGMYTIQGMTSLQQFTTATLQSNPYAITSGTVDVPVSSTWIASVSDTLRQGDYVTLIPIEKMTASNSANLVTPTMDLSNLLVLSVHATGNEEVTTPPSSAGSQSLGTRYSGTGTPSNLDLKMTESQAQEVATDVQQNDQFLVLGMPRAQIRKESR